MHTPSRIHLVLEQFYTKQTWTVHPTLIHFFTPCQVTEKGKLRAFIALVNHNSVLEHMVVDICSTMMGEYCGSNNSHMQEMGDDAGVIVGWDDGSEVSYFQVLYTSYSNLEYYE
jgi:hypothetical protein